MQRGFTLPGPFIVIFLFNRLIPYGFQSCLKRGIGPSCAYPDPDASDHQSSQHTPGKSSQLVLSNIIVIRDRRYSAQRADLFTPTDVCYTPRYT
jgi:hypothetical protein